MADRVRQHRRATITGFTRQVRRWFWRIAGTPPRTRAVERAGATIAPGAALIGDVEVGGQSTVGANATIHGPVTIGRYCQIGPSVAIYGRNHPKGQLSSYVGAKLFDGRLRHDAQVRPVTIGHDVWIGHGATILPGVRVGNGAVIGAAALVASDVAPFTIVVGNPARPIGRRIDDSLVPLVERWAWWDLDPDDLADHEPIFHLDLREEDGRAAFRRAVGDLLDDPDGT